MVIGVINDQSDSHEKCKQSDYFVHETDLIRWFYDVEQDNTFILERVAVAWVNLEEAERCYYSTALDYCEQKFELGEQLKCIDISMRRYRDIVNAFDESGNCWFHEGKSRTCKISNVKPESCRRTHGFEGRTELNHYPHRISEKGKILLQMHVYNLDIISHN